MVRSGRVAERGRPGGPPPGAAWRPRGTAMKGVLRAGCVLVVVAALAYVGPSCPGPPPRPPAPKSRVALVNMAYVFKHLEKWTASQNEMKEDFKQYETRMKELKEEFDAATKALKSPDTPA